MGIPIPRDEKAERLAARIRAVEEKIVEVYPTDVMQTPVHLSLGQEAIAAAVCSHLNNDDLKIGTHRGHALYIANGGDLAKFFGELLGRECGCSGGRGGSMHLTDPEHGLVGTTSIVGGCLPIACGLAMTVKPPRIVACFFGDGACDEGVFYESLSFAKLHRLPVLFVCENNGVSVETPEADRRSWAISKFVRSLLSEDHFTPFFCRTESLQSMAEGVGPNLASIRTIAGWGPQFFEFQRCNRAYGHQGVEKEAEPPHIDVPQDVRHEVEAAYQEALRSPKAVWND